MVYSKGVITASGIADPRLPYINTTIVIPLPGAILHFDASREKIGSLPIWRDIISGQEFKSNNGDGAPTVMLDALGHKVVYFDGIDDMLTMPLVANQPSTTIAVARLREVKNSSLVVSGASGPATNIGTNSASSFWVLNAGKVIAAPGASPVDTNTHVFIGVANGINSVIRVDGNEVTGDAGANNRTLLRVGYGAGYEKLNVYALAVLPYAADATERAAIYARLKAEIIDAH